MHIDENLKILLNAEHLSVSLRWLNLMSVEEKWGLAHEEKLRLLGNISDLEFDSLRNLDERNSLTELAISVLERLVLLILIAKNLAAMVGAEQSLKAFNADNSNRIFNYQSLKSYLLDSESVEQFYMVLRYLENNTH